MWLVYGPIRFSTWEWACGFNNSPWDVGWEHRMQGKNQWRWHVRNYDSSFNFFHRHVFSNHHWKKIKQIRVFNKNLIALPYELHPLLRGVDRLCLSILSIKIYMSHSHTVFNNLKWNIVFEVWSSLSRNKIIQYHC